MATAKCDQSLFMRVSSEDIARLEALVERHPILTRAALARAAMRIGLEIVEKDPTVLLGQPVPKRGGARKGAGRKGRGER